MSSSSTSLCSPPSPSFLPVSPHSFVLCPSSAVSSPPWAPATSCSFGHPTPMTCTQAAVPSSPANAAVSPAGRSPHPTRGHSCHGMRMHVCPCCFALWLMHSLWYFYTLCARALQPYLWVLLLQTWVGKTVLASQQLA